ncbi:hypothetical protein, partial [Amycolatopsis sp. NPDC000740]
MAARPLPRSLDPLPDGSLVGFLLRLSHRLEIPPNRLARLAGLGIAVRRRHQLQLSADDQWPRPVSHYVPAHLLRRRRPARRQQ